MGLLCDDAVFLCAGLEPATCCLGDNCPYSAEPVPVGSSQLRLGGDSGQCGLVGCSRAWWNDCGNDRRRPRPIRCSACQRASPWCSSPASSTTSTRSTSPDP